MSFITDDYGCEVPSPAQLKEARLEFTLADCRAIISEMGMPCFINALNESIKEQEEGEDTNDN